MTATKPLAATIIKTYGSDGIIRIRIEDEASHIVVAEFEMTYEQFGKFVAAPTTVEVQVAWKVDRLGWKFEHKVENVPVVYGTSKYDSASRKEAERAALGAFEVGGWKARHGDISNHHRRVPDSTPGVETYRVTFFRYVKPTSAEE